VTGAQEIEIELGVARTYRRARRAMRRAMAEPLVENFHEWRKHVKDHGYQLRLLRCLWPEAVAGRLAAVERLSALLGDERDVAMLAGAIAAEGRRLGRTGRRHALTTTIDQRRVRLLARAIALGEELFTERPADFLDRLRGQPLVAA
jgi:hypothetical protein